MKVYKSYKKNKQQKQRKLRSRKRSIVVSKKSRKQNRQRECRRVTKTRRVVGGSVKDVVDPISTQAAKTEEEAKNNLKYLHCVKLLLFETRTQCPRLSWSGRVDGFLCMFRIDGGTTGGGVRE